ncbi:CBM35 domain-containing protein [Nonomuraea guangzhouensis]|uniref:CBM35 domain-containing protein n=1 Tax=Nonomuraea guangzhouensis TaxID=1291555 RepID=A0ABW4GDZ1_9ACTN|nr:CBM35 domain-containing protein [Nonomuraea guangzhouensis]
MSRTVPVLAVLTLLAAALIGGVAQAAAATRYEAEAATISKGVFEASHTGFSGTGYVNGDNVSGSYLEFSVTAPSAGPATLALRYANGTTANRPATITVNGTAIATGQAFNGTGNWDTWATATLTATLQAGANSVRITATTANGNPNLDFLDVTMSSTQDIAYQAETAVLAQAAVASNHTGFTGTGFVDYVNTTGGYVEWMVNVPEAARTTLTLRYANGTTANRPLDISVNGTVVAAGQAFNPTTNWDTWADLAITASLNEGTNTVRATATGTAGGPNLDKLTVSGPIDSHPPTAPGPPSQTDITSASVTVTWAASADDVGVAFYDLFGDGRACGTVSGQTTTGTCTGLSADADHVIHVVARDAAGNVSPPSPDLTVHTTVAQNPYGDPYLVSMFDGSTLDGWTPHAAAGWTVKSGAIHGTGTAGRGWIYYNKQQTGTFRWIFNVRQVSGDHAPTVLIWGTTTPIRDALSAIQFQPPNGGHWDYRPGHNNGGGSLFTQFPHTKWDIHNWSQCELVANQSTGQARMACCPLTASAPTCTAVEVLAFKDTTAGQVGPLAIQIHNSGIQDEYRGLYLESPVVVNPDGFITTG